MKFAFIIMGPFDQKADHTSIHHDTAYMVGVPTVEAACQAAQDLAAKGVDCIELCGAFGEEGARKVIEATENKLPIGYVVHLPEQDALFDAVFSGKK